MQTYIFYNTENGEIFNVKKLRNDSKADEMVNGNPSFPVGYVLQDSLNGVFLSLKSQKLDLTTTPFTIIKRPYQTVPPLSEETKQIRNRKLLASDWTQGADSPLSDSKKAEWQTYRQALRDLDYHSVLEGESVTWPSQPS